MKELDCNVSSSVHLVRVHPLPVLTIIHDLHQQLESKARARAPKP